MKRAITAVALALLVLFGTLASAEQGKTFQRAASLDDLQRLIGEEAGKIEGNVGVYIIHVESGESIALNADTQFQLASVFKIPVLVTLFKLIDEGHYSLDDRIVLSERMKTFGSGLLADMKSGLNPSINDLQLLMMAVSDNTATDILFEMVGAERISEYMAELGLTQTVIDLDTHRLILGYLGLGMNERLTRQQLNRTPLEYWMSKERRERLTRFDGEVHDASTPREIGMLLEKLVKGEIVDRETSDVIISTLRHHTGARLITRFLPFGVSVARKGGSLARDGRETVLNDGGIVFLPRGEHLVICVFGNDLRSPWYEFEEAAGYISRYAYDYFTSTSAKSE